MSAQAQDFAQRIAALLIAVAQNPDGTAARILERLTAQPITNLELLGEALRSEDSATRLAVGGLLYQQYRNLGSECLDALGCPRYTISSPAQGAVVRDVVVLPSIARRPVAHLRPDLALAQPPSAVPMVVEVTDVRLEARPDLVAVAETALNDRPSETTQLMRALVAGLTAYRQCPTNKINPALSALLAQTLGQSFLGEDLLGTAWFWDTPWTAAIAVPLTNASIGELRYDPQDACPIESSTGPAQPLKISTGGAQPSRAAPRSAATPKPRAAGLDPAISGSGSEATPLGPQNLWAVAVPDAVQDAITKLFFFRMLFRRRAARVVYVPTQVEDAEDAKQFLGQANYLEQSTWGDVANGCGVCFDRSSDQPGLSLDLGALAVGEQGFLNEILSDEALVSISSKLPLPLVPWGNRTTLIPSDMYVLKPIPNTGVALAVTVRVWQHTVQSVPFTRVDVNRSLYRSLRAVVSPADVVTFTPPPLLCVAASNISTPGAQGPSVASVLTQFVPNVNTASSSGAPAQTLFRPSTAKNLLSAEGVSISVPNQLQILSSQQTWRETAAPSQKKALTILIDPSIPIRPTPLFAALLQSQASAEDASAIPLIDMSELQILLNQLTPLSAEAFLRWVNSKIASFRSYRSAAERLAIALEIPRQQQVYLGLVPTSESAVSSFLGSLSQISKQMNFIGYKAFGRTFATPRELQGPLFQSYVQATFTTTP